MKLNELEQKLLSNNIPKDLYSLRGGYPNEAFCINKESQIWEVYYSERGIKSNLKTFNSEEDACNYFYNWLISSLKDMGILN
ncbi:hypothetical protein CU633_12610 [Bacillus sp. V3-13]|uniref:hypothetical protein n=1 Tax=Bacillus sp. V3-13 TaxID=2053728 RepID=UPI000C760068|nr:hypothetical protein [Bacillus sp. V3-13]PLR77050.1 hypothetical protein CU633_12610 [Bacillus sp. V3-13]